MKKFSRLFAVLVLGVFMILGLSTLAAAQEPGTQYHLKATDFGHWENGEWTWNPNFYPQVKLFDDNGTLNMDGVGDELIDFDWIGPAVTPLIQPEAFKWNDGVIINNLFLSKRAYEDSSKNHTRLSFAAVEARLIPDCVWTFDYFPDGTLGWNIMCAENRPSHCYDFSICCDPAGDTVCETGDPVPAGCECENLSIFKIPEEEPQPIAIERISAQLLDANTIVMDSGISEFYQVSSEQFTVAYRWKPGYWEGTRWIAGQEIRIETDPALFTPQSGTTYTAKIVIDGGKYLRDIDIGPGNFDVKVPLVSSTIDTPFVTPSGKETKKILTVNNITAFERDNGNLAIQWGEPIVDPVFDGGRIELRPIVEWDRYYLWIEAPPQTGTVNLPQSEWNELKTKIPEGQSATVRIIYRAISGESGGGTPEYSRCEVRTYSDPIPVH